MWETCPKCKGTGEYYDAASITPSVCKICLGGGIINSLTGEPRKVKVWPEPDIWSEIIGFNSLGNPIYKNKEGTTQRDVDPTEVWDDN